MTHSFNGETMRRAALRTPEEYITRTGTSYFGVKAYDKKGTYLGIAVYFLTNEEDDEKPTFCHFFPRGTLFEKERGRKLTKPIRRSKDNG